MLSSGRIPTAVREVRDEIIKLQGPPGYVIKVVGVIVPSDVAEGDGGPQHGLVEDSLRIIGPVKLKTK